jgi:hypothetical protein
MKLMEAYSLGANLAFEKLAVTDTALTAATGFVSPLASGLTAEEGKGLQTSLSGIAGSLIGKKLLRNDLAGRLLGSAGATLGSKVGAGLVSPDPEVIERMKRRGEFSKWDYLTRGLQTAKTGAKWGAGLGAAFGSGGLVPAAALGAAAGAGRGAFSGFVISPMIRNIMQNIKNQQDNPAMADDKRLLPQALNHPATKKIMEKAKKFDHPELEGIAANVIPLVKNVAMRQDDDNMLAQQGEE